MDYNLYDGYVYVFCALMVCVCVVSGLTAFHILIAVAGVRVV